MKEYKPAEIRNFAVVGHASSGKTMLSEAMLACAGVINRMGSINAGSTVNYTGAGAQTVLATTYQNLGFSGAGTKTVGTSMTVAGNASIATDGETLAGGGGANGGAAATVARATGGDGATTTDAGIAGISSEPNGLAASRISRSIVAARRA